jgi:hypothetical protein
VKINFNIPSDVEPKAYNFVIKVKGNTSDGKVMNANKSASITITAMAQNQPPSLFTEQSNTTSNEVIFSLEWSDDYGLSGYIFSSNISGEWKNDSWVPLEGTSGLFNVSKALNSTSSAVAWKIYANDSSNEWTSSNEYVVISRPETTGPSIILIIASVVVVAIAVIFFISRKGFKKEEKKIEYIFKKEEIENEKKP